MSTQTASNYTGRPVELGRYETSEGGRVLIGRRIEGEVHVFDIPHRRQGRRYFVEAGFDTKAELAVLIADYRRQAKRLCACPMAPAAIERSFAAPGEEPPPGQHRTP